jgi:putative Mg2+ transporter-C (MgtC) family protein
MFGLSFDCFALGLRLALAVLVGGILGLNRDLHRKPAGVRTHALVSLGSAVVTMLIFETTQHAPDALSRVMQGLLTGVGFLGAGVIIHHDMEHRVEGLTTAASVWIVAILGMACGAGQGGIVLMGVLLTLAVLIFGGPIEHAFARWFNTRRPPLP